MSDIDLYIQAAPIRMEISGAQGPALGGGGGAWDDLTGTANHIPFAPSPTAVPTDEGTVSWNADDHTLNLQTDIAGVVQQVGQEQHIRVRNVTGSTISNGSVVYLSGASGQRPTISLADADEDTHVLATIGVATADIDHNAFGYVTTMGLVRGVNTNGMTEGGAIYLSTTAGAFTQSVPTGNKVRVGWCVIAGNSGTILVHVERLSIKSADVTDATDQPTASTIAKRGSGGECYFSQIELRSGSGLELAAATISTTGITWSKNEGLDYNHSESIPASGSYEWTNPSATGIRALTDQSDGKTNLANSVTGTLPLANGGTGATTAKGAVTNLVTVTDNANTSIVLADSDSGTILRCTASSAVAISVPSTLAAGFNVLIIQAGTGQVTISAGSGATVNSYGSFTKTAGRHAAATLVRVASATYNLSGNLA